MDFNGRSGEMSVFATVAQKAAFQPPRVHWG